jgi:diguanylate cyclase
VKYTDSIERSAALLRKALPLMSRQEAALHPISYALWYEYVTDGAPQLKAAVDAHLSQGGKLDEHTTRRLYAEHIAPFDAHQFQQLTTNFQRVMRDVASSADQAGAQATRFEHSLSRLSASLQDAEPTPAALVADTLADTQTTLHALVHLQQQLDDSRAEIDRLRDEVQQARQEAVVDALTGLANRRGFDQSLAASLAVVPVSNMPPCLLMGDIDHFKRINDSFGHGFGDQVLKIVGQVLQGLVPAGAVAARVGGEEFAVLLPSATLDEAQQLAEAICKRISAARIRRPASDETLSRITLSLGVTLHRIGESAQAFFERADQALYASKSGGRDRVTVLPA